MNDTVYHPPSGQHGHVLIVIGECKCKQAQSHFKPTFVSQLVNRSWASQVALVVKSMPANAGSCKRPRVQSLGWEDSLEEDMATYSNILAWRIPRTEEPGGLKSTWSHRVRQD